MESNRPIRARLRGLDALTVLNRPVAARHLSVPVKIREGALAVLTARIPSLPKSAAIDRFLPKLPRCAARIGDQFSALQADARNGTSQTAA